MLIKKKDFVEIEYTGRLKENNLVFDTTDEKAAKENKIFSEDSEYKPIVICIGEGHVLKGLDEKLEGKELGKYTIELAPEQAFGKKDPKLMQLIQTNKFLQQGIRPVPGLQINMDGLIGTVRSVSGGRTIMDFNHPLSGKDVVYEVKVNKIVTDEKEKISAMIKRLLGLKNVKVDVKDKKTNVMVEKKLPEEVVDALKKKIIELVDMKEVQFSFEEEKQTEKKENKAKENIPQNTNQKNDNVQQ